MGQLDHRPATRMAWKQEFLGCKRQTEPIGSLYTAKSAVMREMDHVARVFSHESARSTAHDPWLYRIKEKETRREKDFKKTPRSSKLRSGSCKMTLGSFEIWVPIGALAAIGVTWVTWVFCSAFGRAWPAWPPMPAQCIKECHIGESCTVGSWNFAKFEAHRISNALLAVAEAIKKESAWRSALRCASSRWRLWKNSWLRKPGAPSFPWTATAQARLASARSGNSFSCRIIKVKIYQARPLIFKRVLSTCLSKD